MAQHCTNNQLNILNNNIGPNENIVNNGELSIVSMPIAHFFTSDALQIIKERANIPHHWSRARIANWLGDNDRIDLVTNGFIMLPVFHNLHIIPTNLVEIHLTLDDLYDWSREQIFNVAFPNNPVLEIIEYINRVPCNVVNLNRIRMRIPYYVEENNENEH
uniref:Uncharacterized protein n=1 Tax=viral metagenome TaxID=1070528 RepID=A0A6C0CPG8_9ZZZZ